MDKLELIVRRIPMGQCPFCKHKQFIVSEIVQTEYLTNRDGQIIDSIEPKYDAVGMCLNCNHTFPMKPIFDGFVPMTPLRQFIDKYIDYGEKKFNVSEVKNPMQKEDKYES